MYIYIYVYIYIYIYMENMNQCLWVDLPLSDAMERPVHHC